jgi:hypothetical protein
MTTTTIEIDALYPDGTACVGREVSCRLIDGGAGASTGDGIRADVRTVRLDANGHAELDLVPNEELTPAGTFYRLSLVGSVSNLVRNIEVPASESPISWAENSIQVLSPVPPQFTTGVVDATGLATYDPDTRTIDVPAQTGDDIAVDLTDYAGIGVTADNVQDGLDQAFAGLVTVSGTVAGLTTSSLAVRAVGQATAGLPRSTRITATAVPGETVTNAEWTGKGLTYWPDGNIGYATIGATTYGFSANGSVSARWVATTSDRLGTVNAASVALTTLEPADYASGGPIYHDTGNGNLIKLWHGEVHDSDPAIANSFMSFLGLAVADESTPDTWTDLGRIVTATCGADAPIFHDLANSGMVVHGGYVYVIFSERTGTTTANSARGAFSVARASLSAVTTWANGGAAATFTKWHEGAWTEPGIEGESSELIVVAPWPVWSDIIHVSSVGGGRFLLVWTGQTLPYGPDNRWCVYASISEPGDITAWSHPEIVIGPTTAELTYVSLADSTSLSTDLSDASTLKLTVVSSVAGATGTGGDRWTDAELLTYDLAVSVDPPKLRLSNLAAVPPGPNVVGDLAVISGVQHVCTVAGTPGTWTPLQTATTGSWQTATLVNSWANGFGTARYRRIGADGVEIQIPAIYGGASASAAFQLPVGYRPSEEQSFPTFSTADGIAISGASVAVDANGDVWAVTYPDATKPVV